ncbi:MAG: phosphatidate cytidylyltransferase [Pelagibacteraceae bacterium]|jgi:phosphatidate cytidylyltransferase|nr:phosphatidate cytidylyltransferase [Pelagibacteraceae bacterium]MDP6709794.1 phosphatidate cytidylyltransferase [Pelagibacteraceae bacterium]|tara:strand:- start:5057 stop:5719 length:663 start_codon:yes stop_codon:yes gene_type:complete
MTKESQKRIITSILLFLLVIFCIFVHKYFFITAILVISYFAFDEICIIIVRVRNLNELAKFLFRFISLFYLFGIFALSAIGLYFADGPFFFLYILSICICSDIGGYIIGKSIGGKKLTKISPNKTISGSFGSFCFSIVPLLIFYNINSSEYLLSISNFLMCLFTSLVCQLGDLFISYLKRKAKVKDTGNILPGHGGLMDRVDGIIFAIPFAFILSKLIIL